MDFNFVQQYSCFNLRIYTRSKYQPLSLPLQSSGCHDKATLTSLCGSSHYTLDIHCVVSSTILTATKDFLPSFLVPACVMVCSKASIKRESDTSDAYLFSKKLRCNMNDGPSCVQFHLRSECD